MAPVYEGRLKVCFKAFVSRAPLSVLQGPRYKGILKVSIKGFLFQSYRHCHFRPRSNSLSLDP